MMYMHFVAMYVYLAQHIVVVNEGFIMTVETRAKPVEYKDQNVSLVSKSHATACINDRELCALEPRALNSQKSCTVKIVRL